MPGRFTLFLRENIDPLLALLVAIICLAVSYATGFWTLFRLTYLICMAVPILWLWSRMSISKLEVEVDRDSRRISQGGFVTTSITIRSSSWFPKIWLEAEDTGSLPVSSSGRVFTVGARGVYRWTYKTQIDRRGLYTLGPLQIRATDPFGFFSSTAEFGEPTEILVYPTPPDLPKFDIPSANLPGEGKIRTKTSQVTPSVAGVRNYLPGDSYNRFHWPATARTGRLMVKEFDMDPSSAIWVVVDLDSSVNDLYSDDQIEDTIVMTAATLAKHFNKLNRSVGLISCGQQEAIIKPGRGNAHLSAMMQVLALARSTDAHSYVDVIDRESRRFDRHVTFVGVTAGEDSEVLRKITEFRFRGGTAVLLSVLHPGTTNIDSDFDSECVRSKIPRLVVHNLETIATDLTFDNKIRSRSVLNNHGD
ncbi:MAG: hypothetical protein CL729_02695 [Chloroflexi bacterium]|nr:hypothetical protein [Chloroflexota bacterium]